MGEKGQYGMSKQKSACSRDNSGLNILIVFYHFIGKSSVGAFHIRRLAKYWQQEGHRVSILAHSDSSEVSDTDATGAKLIPVTSIDLRAISSKLQKWRNREGSSTSSGSKTEIKSKPLRITGLLQRYCCVPDVLYTWYRPAVRQGRTSIKECVPDVIIASIYPRTDALIAAHLAKRFNIPLIIEYRDL